jgi:hypothetical protein
MNARILTTTTLAIAFSVVLPAKAADPQLVGLLMPDAQVVAGVNVDQAKATPFGQYVLSQVQTSDPKFQELISLTGFDPTRDVREVLVASNNTSKTSHTGLFLARGNFDPGKIAAAATEKGAATETYGGVTILEDPKQTNGIAFLSASLVVAGDLASVKAAIDRQKLAAPIPANLAVLINQWSTSQDGWAISAVPLSALHPSTNAPNLPGLNGQGAFQAIQSAAGGVKFGNNIVVTGQAMADTAQNAQAMADALKLLVNLAQMQAGNDPRVAALIQSLQINATGTVLNVSVSLPEDQFEQMVKAKPQPQQRRPAARRGR